MKFRLLVSAALLVVAYSGSGMASDVVSFSDEAAGRAGAASVFIGAKPMELPRVKRLQSSVDFQRSRKGTTQKPKLRPSFRKGFDGGPVAEMVQIIPERAAGVNTIEPKQAVSAESGVVSMAYGEAGIPFSTSRVELNAKSADVIRLYPYRAAGRLAFRVSGGTAHCSAALIDKGILLTAAHCVTDYGGPKFSGFTFIPGYHKGQGAYGTFTASRVYVKASYANGTGDCVQGGVVCESDVALIVLKPNATGKYPGELTGWFGTGWDGYGFTSSGETHVTQLGYPGSLDRGSQMIRNDSMGYADADARRNSVIGSSMDGGSSGGPWVINLGSQPRYAIGKGEASDPNLIVGVTSWGYDDVYLEQGSSPLTSANIGELLAKACRNHPAACSN